MPTLTSTKSWDSRLFPEPVADPSIRILHRELSNGSCSLALRCSSERGDEVSYSWDSRENGIWGICSGNGSFLNLSYSLRSAGFGCVCTARNPVSSRDVAFDSSQCGSEQRGRSRNPGMPESWNPRTPETRNPRIPESWNPRTPEPWNPRILESHVRNPEPQNPGTLKSQNPRIPEPQNPRILGLWSGKGPLEMSPGAEDTARGGWDGSRGGDSMGRGGIPWNWAWDLCWELGSS